MNIFSIIYIVGIFQGFLLAFVRSVNFPKRKPNNQVLIDSTYLAEATSTKVSANFNGEPYGYYFWILPASKSYAALGHGGQFLLVAPEKNLVVVYTAWAYTNTKFFDQRIELIEIINNSCN